MNARRLAEEYRTEKSHYPDQQTVTRMFDWLLSRIREDNKHMPDYKFRHLFDPGGKYGPDPEPVKPNVIVNINEDGSLSIDGLPRCTVEIRDHGHELEE